VQIILPVKEMRMKRWQGSCIGAFLALLICGGSMLFIVPVGGAMIVGVPPLFDKLTGWAVCPGAVSISQEEYNSGPVTSSPTGMTGHQEEWTCTFEDGTQKVIPNEEIALKGLGASAAAVGILGGIVTVLGMIIAAIIGARLVKPKTI
jgi:hypothetical protein